MKKVGGCQSCGRNMYTNDLDLCKRCFNEVGLEFLKTVEVEEVEEGPSLEELGIESSAEGEPAEQPEVKKE